MLRRAIGVIFFGLLATLIGFGALSALEVHLIDLSQDNDKKIFFILLGFSGLVLLFGSLIRGQKRYQDAVDIDRGLDKNLPDMRKRMSTPKSL